MPLTSMRFLVLCICLAIALPVALFILWRRAPRKSGWATAAFLVGMVVAQTATVSAVAVNVNRDYGFYPDWASLWGTPVAPPVVQAGTRLGVNAVRTRRLALPPISGSASDVGRYERIALKGAQSGITATVMTWLPPQYYDHRYSKTRFPVVMVLGGGAGLQIPFIVELHHFATTASREIRSGRGGTLRGGVPGDERGSAPVDRVHQLPRRATGLHLAQPGCQELGHLDPAGYHRWPAVERHGLVHRRVHLLVMSSDTDPQSYPQALEFLRRERNVPGIQPYLVKDLGHNIGAYKAVLVPVLDWLAAVADA